MQPEIARRMSAALRTSPDALDRVRVEATDVGPGFNEGGDLPTSAEKGAGDGRSDESGRAGDQRTALGLHHHRMRANASPWPEGSCSRGVG